MNQPVRHPLDALLARAEAAREAHDIAGGLVLANEAWAAVRHDDDSRRLRSGLLLTHFYYRSGAMGLALQCGLSILPLVREREAPPALSDHLRMVTLAACETQQFDTAFSLAQEAHALSLSMNDDNRTSLTLNVLGCVFERTGDPWQAEQLLMESLARSASDPDGHARFTALNNFGACMIGKHYLLRDALPAEEAAEPLRTALPFAEEAAAHARVKVQAFFRVFTLGNLGEILVHLGETERAQSALDTALAIALEGGFQAQIWRLRCSLGELLLSRGQTLAARDALAAVLLLDSIADLSTAHLRLHHALWRCERRLGNAEAALHHLQRYVQLERKRTIHQLSAQSNLFVTRMEADHSRQDARQQQQRAKALEIDALHDQLTGLSNRRELDQRWPTLRDHARDKDEPLAVAMLDLDGFKHINDTHGHALGDRVLIEAAELLRACTRGSDLVVRYGGEEFLLLLPHTTEAAASDVCERVRQRMVAHDWSRLASGLRVTISGGLACAPAVALDALRERADAALYCAKSEGRNRIVLANA